MSGKGSGRKSKAKPKPRAVGEAEVRPPSPVRERKHTPSPVGGNVDEDSPSKEFMSFNRRSIELGKALMRLPKIDDWSDPDVLLDRFMVVLDLLEEWQIVPNASNVALGFGVDGGMFVDIALGRYPRYKGLTRASLKIVSEIYSFLKQNLENNLLNERGNPVKWIFLGKNYFGLTDSSEKVIKHENEKPELPKSENVVGKYAGLVGQRVEELPEATIVNIESVEQEAEYEEIDAK